MGCRAAKSAFMPNRYVFPGGRVDQRRRPCADRHAVDRHVKARLLKAATEQRAQALGVAAVRETFEETGLILGKPLEGRRAEEGLSASTGRASSTRAWRRRSTAST